MRGIDRCSTIRGGRLACLAVDGDDQTAVEAALDASYLRLEPDRRRVLRLPGPGHHPALPGTGNAAIECGMGVRCGQWAGATQQADSTRGP